MFAATVPTACELRNMMKADSCKSHQLSHLKLTNVHIFQCVPDGSPGQPQSIKKHCYFSHCVHSPGPHPTRSNPCYSSLHRSGCSSHSISWLAQCEGKEKREENLMLEKFIVSHTVKAIVIRVKI